MPKRKLSKEEKEAHLKNISFENLVRELDEKWSDTYEDYVEDDTINLTFLYKES